MSLTDAQFVIIPNFYNLDKLPIQYLDILVYTALKSFDNDEEDCFPKHETVAKRAGMSKRFVIDSIKRLEAARLITVVRSDKKKVSNRYYFNKLQRFEQIPVTLFLLKDLSPNEKAMLICLRQFFIHGPLQCMNDITFFVKWLGLSYNTISPIYKSLVGKGYIKEMQKVNKKTTSAAVLKIMTDKISWNQMGCVRPLQKSSAQYIMLKVA